MMRNLSVLLLSIATPALAAPLPPAVTTDPAPDKAHPARMEVLHVASGGVAINGVAYIPSGAGPHPVLVIAHGWPGNEKNLDLAQAVRRAGWIAVTFNYRGSWGSPGEFHFRQNPEDARAVIAWLRDPANAKLVGADPNRIAIAGHSMGAWVAAKVSAVDPRVLGAALISMGDMGTLGPRPRSEVLEIAAGNAETLVTTPEKMADELADESKTLALTGDAAGAARHPLLVLTSDDGGAPMSEAFAVSVERAGGKVARQHVATDHSWSDRRLTLQGIIIDWLGTLR